MSAAHEGSARSLVEAWRRDGTVAHSRALPDGAIVTRAEWLRVDAPPADWLADQGDEQRLRAGLAIVPVDTLDELARLASEGLHERARRRAPRHGRPNDVDVLTLVLRAWLAGSLADRVTLDEVLAVPGMPEYYGRHRGRRDNEQGPHVAPRARLRELLRMTPVRLRVGRPPAKPTR